MTIASLALIGANGLSFEKVKPGVIKSSDFRPRQSKQHFVIEIARKNFLAFAFFTRFEKIVICGDTNKKEMPCAIMHSRHFTKKRVYLRSLSTLCGVRHKTTS